MSERSIELAILRTITYADVFDYPLRPIEVHRYLIGETASSEKVFHALQSGRLAQKHLNHIDGFITLKGREALVPIRERREQKAARLWPRAARYGKIIAQLPFVRMVAVTGALAVNNVDGRIDLDYLVVSEPGYLWLCRATVILLVRWAELRGDTVCPNYFLSENCLAIPDRNLYTAHELAQMVPLAGIEVYRRMRAVNDWSIQFLPNATGLPAQAGAAAQETSPSSTRISRSAARLAETALRSPAGDWLERWEMNRKIMKFKRSPGDHPEIDFGADWCKGHFEGHGRRALAAHAERIRELGIEN